MFLPLLRLSADASLLMIESHGVVMKRVLGICSGTGSVQENVLMVSEKIGAMLDAGTTVAAGGSVHEVIRDYRTVVSANARRLAGS